MNAQGPVRVGDGMAPDLDSIGGVGTVADAMALMKSHDVETLVVNRRDETDEVGLVLASDVAREVIARNRSPERVNVYEIMSKPVLTLPPDMLTRYAVRLLVRFQVSRSIVVDNDRNPIGFVTLRDLVISR